MWKGCAQTARRYAQTAFRKCADNGVSALLKRAVSVRCVSVTAIETLRGERMCADNGGVYADNVQEMHRHRKGERLRGTVEGLIAIERLRVRGRGARG